MSGLEAGSTLGGYEILARLRAGAMGVLYLGRRVGAVPHHGFSRPVAIKVIHDHLAQNKRFARMFIDEAKLSARIDDPNVVRVQEFGEADGRYYLVMEYVQGCSLAQVLQVVKKLSVDHAVAIAMQLCAGLHGAHEATDEDGVPLGIVHRDVSPHNVLVSFKGFVRIIDFGIAKARLVGGQTKTGSLRGKLAYMPPEQARSARTVDRRADLYAAGLILWEMLTGRRVFDADTDIAILNQIRNPVIVPPSTFAPAVPKALDALLMATLDQDPNMRPADAAELQRRLADAVPSALRVLPRELAGVLERVRVTLTSGKVEDDVDGYADDLQKSLTSFGKGMHEGMEHADELQLDPDDLEPDDEDHALTGDTHPRPAPFSAAAGDAGAGGGEQDETQAMIRDDQTAAMVVEEERTVRFDGASKKHPDSGRTPVFTPAVSRKLGGVGTARITPPPPSAPSMHDFAEAIPSSRGPAPPLSSRYPQGRPSLPGEEPTSTGPDAFEEIRRYFVAHPWAAAVVVLVPLVAVVLLVALLRSEPKPAYEPPAPTRAIH